MRVDNASDAVCLLVNGLEGQKDIALVKAGDADGMDAGRETCSALYP
jgi:hypothetical protein